MSEYLAARDERIAFLSGFTGSNGTALIMREDTTKNIKEEALMWVDGRYYIQAQNELYAGAGWTMMKSEVGHKDVFEWVKDNLPEGTRIGCDEAQVPWKTYQYMEK